MDTQLQYDPRTKQFMLTDLINYLYLPVQKQLEIREKALIVRNTLLGGYTDKSFIYKGKLYFVQGSLPPRKANRLIPQLVHEFNEYLQDRKAVLEQEIPYTKGYLTHVLNQSSSVQDYMQLLPDVMHPVLQRYSDMCPCKIGKLTPQQVDSIKAEHQHSIQLLKQRMVKNLLL